MGRKLLGSVLALLAFAILWAFGPGCKSSVPPTSAMSTSAGVPIQSCPPVLFEGFESLSTGVASNGTTFYVTDRGITINDYDLTDAGTTFSSVLGLSNFGATQGTHSLDLDIIKAFSYNQTMFQMFGFSPNVWNTVAQLKMDITVDPSVVAGNTYSFMNLVGYSTSTGVYFTPISSDAPNVTAGTQTITWNINFSAGVINPAAPMDRLYIIYNRSTPNAGQGIGNIYIDNMRLVYNADHCPSSPTATPTPLATTSPVPTPTPQLCGIAPTSTPALLDDMEDGNNQVLLNECRNGYWYAYNDGTAGGIQKTGAVTWSPTYTFTMASGGVGVGYGCTGTSNDAVEVSTNAGFTNYGAGFGCNLTTSTSTGLFDAQYYGYTGVQFCAKNTTGPLSPTCFLQEREPVTLFNPSGSGTTVLAFQTTNSLTTSWTSISVPFSSVTLSSPSTLTLDTTALFGLQWQVNASTTTDVWIDNIVFY